MEPSLLTILRHSQLVAGQQPESLVALVRQLRVVCLTAGDRLFTVGDSADAAYLLTLGTLQIRATDDTLLDTEQPGALVGEQALMPGGSGRRNATVVAETDCRLLEVDRATFAKLLSQRQSTLEQISAARTRNRLGRTPKYSFDDLAGIQDNVDGPAFARAAAQMWADPEGRRLMHDRSLLTVAGADWVYFSQLPVDSFGYNVWHHFYVNGLMQDIELEPSRLRWDEDTEYAKARYRSSHDMRHVFLGLGVEVYEEVSLQVFQYAQLPQKLSALVVGFGLLKLMFSDRRWRKVLAYAPHAWRSGKRGRPLHCIYFEDLWACPLAELRERYGITPVGTRYPVDQRHPDAYHFQSPHASPS